MNSTDYAAAALDAAERFAAAIGIARGEAAAVIEFEGETADLEPIPEQAAGVILAEEAAAQSADQLAAIAGRKAAEALDAYAAALNHAAEVAFDNRNTRLATARHIDAVRQGDAADQLRREAARLA